MAYLHLLKEGRRPNGDRITRTSDLTMDEAIAAFGACGHKHTQLAPTINPEVRAHDFAEYRFGVLEAEADETRAPFEKPGYYYLVGLSPPAAQEKLGETWGRASELASPGAVRRCAAMHALEG